ncbi:hypothetical protein PMI07_005852 [Rhizobium sp. CF080]|uniref:hypothetical protein n=1 Tax=Rhizobium sp. (strain CF080) TaxID=1144310 RepID=UPI000271D669|nr:hypothetical protein [Rhizobium sp. CF080]EUB99571.1 hypothetical protein PMI07_005852 [Rhizobium sp. CF080]
MLMGMNANGRHAENYAHLLDPAAIACASRQTLPETAAVFRFLPDAFNQVACAAIIR